MCPIPGLEMMLGSGLQVSRRVPVCRKSAGLHTPLGPYKPLFKPCAFSPATPETRKGVPRSQEIDWRRAMPERCARLLLSLLLVQLTLETRPHGLVRVWCRGKGPFFRPPR